MSLLDELLEEIAEENLTAEDREHLKQLLKSRMQKRGGAQGAIQRADAVSNDEFPAGPNAAMAIERRERAARLALEEESLSREQAIERFGPAHERGIRKYGYETPAQAEARWRDQEIGDTEGVYGPGGATAGGIFGDGTISMPDYDPGAHSRGGAREAQVLNLRMAQVLDRIIDRLDGGNPSAALRAGEKPARLPQGGKNRR